MNSQSSVRQNLILPVLVATRFVDGIDHRLQGEVREQTNDSRTSTFFLKQVTPKQQPHCVPMSDGEKARGLDSFLQVIMVVLDSSQTCPHGQFNSTP